MAKHSDAPKGMVEQPLNAAEVKARGNELAVTTRLIDELTVQMADQRAVWKIQMDELQARQRQYADEVENRRAFVPAQATLDDPHAGFTDQLPS